MWDSRRFIAHRRAALSFVPAHRCSASWLTHDQRALDASATPAERQDYVDDQFEQYYSDQPHALFFTEVTTNNILVSFLAFAGGAAVLRLRRLPAHLQRAAASARPRRG